MFVQIHCKVGTEGNFYFLYEHENRSDDRKEGGKDGEVKAGPVEFMQQSDLFKWKSFSFCYLLYAEKGTSFGTFPQSITEKVQRSAQFMTENLFIIMCLICNVILKQTMVV